MITFQEMKYERPDLEAVKKQLTEITERLKNAETYAEAKQAFLDKDTLYKHVATAEVISSIRHDINTKDEFYDAESKFWNRADRPLFHGMSAPSNFCDDDS